MDRDRVSEWLDWWEKAQFDGLDDDPRSGRPPKLTEKEQKHAVKLTLKEPRSLRQGLTAIASTGGQDHQSGYAQADIGSGGLRVETPAPEFAILAG